MAEAATASRRYSDTTRALRLAWRALINDVDNGADHAAVQRAAAFASRADPAHSSPLTDDDRSDLWYTVAINHYLDR